MSQPESVGLLTRVFRSAGIVVIGSGFSKICLIAVELFLAAVLGAAGYGLFSIAFALLLVTSTLALAGFNFGIVQYLGIYTETGDEDARRSVARVSLVLVLVVAGIIGAGIYLGADRLAVSVFGKPELAPLLLIVGLVIPFESLNQCLSAIFRGLRRYRYHTVVLDLVRNVSLLACFPFVIFGTLELETIFQIIAAGTIAGTAIGLTGLSRQLNLLRGFDRDLEVFRRLLSFSYLLFLWQVLQNTANRLTLVIAGALLVASDVGVLAVALRFLNLLNFPQTVFNTTTAVEFARLNHLKDIAGINRMFQVVALILMIIALAVSLPLLLNAGTMMALLGADYAPYGWVLIPLLAARLLDVGTGPAGQVLIACRKRKTMLGISSVDAGLQFLFVVPLIILLGLPGAVYGDTVRILVLVTLRHLALYRLLSVYAITRALVFILVWAFILGSGGALLILLTDHLAWQIALTGMVMLVTGAMIFRIMQGDETIGRPLLAGLIGRVRHWQIAATGRMERP